MDQKHLVDVLLDHSVAFTRNVLECRGVEDLDVAATVADQAGALQQAGCDGHRCAPHAEHLHASYRGALHRNRGRGVAPSDETAPTSLALSAHRANFALINATERCPVDRLGSSRLANPRTTRG